MRRLVLSLAMLLTLSKPVAAQSLTDLINQLFIFGSGESQLFLAGTADPNNPLATQAHADHFIPSAAASNGTLISFISGAVAANISNIPVAATSAGVTYRFEGGAPVATSTGPGPILAERAQTLGRGRVLVAANVNIINFQTLRGVGLDNIGLNFTHVNADFPGCDAAFGGDCTEVGIPSLENDVIGVDLSLDLNVVATTFLLTYGLFDFMDIGVAIPIISTSMVGTSQAQVSPFGGPTAAHFFDGTADNPDLFATQRVEGSTTGLGDIATRLKIAVSQSSQARFSILGDARFATGDAENFLGGGDFSVRGLGVISAQFSGFGPHANVGYLYRKSEMQNDAFLANVGFDQALAPWAFVVLDLLSEFQVGDSELQLPEEFIITQPFRRSIDPTSIPDIRDDIVNVAVGFKFTSKVGLTGVVNSLWPLNDGGLRPHVMWTAGLEFNF